MGLRQRVETKKAQAAIDFLMSYGLALIVIVISVAVIYQISVSHQTLSAYTCTAIPGFSCDFYALNTSGVLMVTLSQATGGQIVINGAACSTQPSSIGYGPAFGNPFVTNAVAYYPTPNGITSAPINGIPVSSGSGGTLSMYCYSPTGTASAVIGSAFTGYLWLNYTTPGYGRITQRIASLSLVYTRFVVR